MSAHQKNLLEAFRNAGNAPKPAGAPPPPPPKSPVEKPPRPPRPPAPAAEGGWRAPAWLPWVAGLGIAFVIGILLGRGSRDVSKAAGSEEHADSAERTAEKDPTPIEGALGDAPPTRGEETPPSRYASALLDPANQYTVIAATYGRTRSDFAWATHDQMKDLGLPAFTPWQREKDILVLVGAAATKEELRDLEARLRRLDGWDGAKSAYADAYIDRIDKLIVRETR